MTGPRRRQYGSPFAKPIERLPTDVRLIRPMLKRHGIGFNRDDYSITNYNNNNNFITIIIAIVFLYYYFFFETQPTQATFKADVTHAQHERLLRPS